MSTESNDIGYVNYDYNVNDIRFLGTSGNKMECGICTHCIVVNRKRLCELHKIQLFEYGYCKSYVIDESGKYSYVPVVEPPKYKKYSDEEFSILKKV